MEELKKQTTTNLQNLFPFYNDISTWISMAGGTLLDIIKYTNEINQNITQIKSCIRKIESSKSNELQTDNQKMQTDNQKILNKKLNNFKQRNKELKKTILYKWQNYCIFKNNDLALFWRAFIALNIINNLEEDEKKI